MNLAQKALAKINEAKTGKKINENVAGESDPGYPVGSAPETITLTIPALHKILALYDENGGDQPMDDTVQQVLAMHKKLGKPLEATDFETDLT